MLLRKAERLRSNSDQPLKLLISGAPGIGKTSLVNLIARTFDHFQQSIPYNAPHGPLKKLRKPSLLACAEASTLIVMLLAQGCSIGPFQTSGEKSPPNQPAT